jgi:hypothetical protein
MKNAGIRGLIIVTATGVLAACAAQPPASPASSAPVAATPAAAAAPAASAAPATGAAQAVDEKQFAKMGYFKTVKNGRTWYCQTERATDSRVKQNQQCLTAEALTALRNDGQDFLRRQQNRVGEQPSAGVNGGVQYSAANPAP